MIRVVIPFHLRNLARVDGEVKLSFDDNSSATIGTVLDALEEQFPMLRGTIRDHGTPKRRPFVRYFACNKDLSLESPDTPLPNGEEPFLVVGAIAGG
jgi:hypothetical protein